MGFSNIFSDFYNSIGLAELHAEAPPEEDKEDDEGADDAGEEKIDDGEKEEGGEEGGEEEGGDDEGGDDEEEEEEEAEDIKPKLEERESMVFPTYLHIILQSTPVPRHPNVSPQRFNLQNSHLTPYRSSPPSILSPTHN